MFKVEQISQQELDNLLKKKESHYLDFKSSEISGKDLQRHIVGFANADGGEVYVGITDNKGNFSTQPFKNIENANCCKQHS